MKYTNIILTVIAVMLTLNVLIALGLNPITKAQAQTNGAPTSVNLTLVGGEKINLLPATDRVSQKSVYGIPVYIVNQK